MFVVASSCHGWVGSYDSCWQPQTYVKPEAAITVLSSWWWAVCRLKHVEQLRKTEIINSTTRSHLVGYFWFIHSFSSLSYDRSKASSKASSPHSAIQYILLQMRVSSLSLRSSNSFLRLLSRLPVTSIHSCIFPSITRCIREFLRKIQFAFHLRISCRIFICSLTLSNTSSFVTWSVQLIFSILLQHHISKLSRCFWSTARSVQVSAPYKVMLQM